MAGFGRSATGPRAVLRNTFWKIVDASGRRYPVMHGLDAVRRALGRTERAYSYDRPFQTYEFIARGNRPSLTRGKGPRVLLATLRGSIPLATGFQALLGQALAWRGAPVVSFSCDGVLDQYCDGYPRRRMSEERCLNCSTDAERNARAFGIPHLRLGRLPNLPRPAPEQVELARRYAHLLFFSHPYTFPWLEELEGWTYSGFRIPSLEALRPGVDERLDALCAAILHGRPVPLAVPLAPA